MHRTGIIIDLALFLAAAAFAVVGYGSHAEADRSYKLIPHRSDSLRVVTWNVGEASGEPWQASAIGHVADTLQKLDADLVFLQEVANRRQFDQLLTKLGKPWSGHLSLRRDRGIAVVAQRGHLEAWEISRRGRPSFAVTFQARSLPKLGAVVVHADAFDAKSRNRQIGEATDYLIQRMDASAKILVGDLNIDLDLDKRRDLFSNNEHLDVETYNYVATHLFDAAIGRGPTAEPDRRLDYIFSDANLAVIDAGPFKDHRAPGMDHDPLVGDLHFVRR